MVAYTDARGRGGAEISLGNLLAAAPDGTSFTVVGVDRAIVGWLAARRPGAASLVLPEGPGGWIPHLRALRRVRPDVVHVNRCVPWACATGIAAALGTPGARVVVVDQLPLRTTDAAALSRTRALSLRVDALVGVSEAGARRIEDFYALGRNSVHAIPNGVPDVPLPARPPRGANDLHVAAVGRLDAMKGHDVLLRAIAQVHGAHLTILGEGSERSALESLARLLRIADRVEMPGWVDAPRRRLPEFDVLAMPSRSEGFPLAVLEGMLAGLPIVATAVGGIPEAVIDGETGLLVPADGADALAGALRRLQADPALRSALGGRARARAMARFTAHRMADAYAVLWRDVCARERAPRLRPPTPRS